MLRSRRADSTRNPVQVQTKGASGSRPGDELDNVVIHVVGFATHTVAPGKIGTDYDLVLWNDSAGYPYFSSQTNDDNNEGFDVTSYNFV